jgi:MFS family permease
MTFAFPFALFPFIAQEYDVPWALGLLYSAGFAGGLVFGLTSGWAIRICHYGRAIALAAASWGAAVGLVAFAPGIWWVLALLAVAGYFDMLSGHFRSLLWNQSIPDEVRGRMAGIEMLSYSLGPMLGQVRSTAAAQAYGLRTSLASGGILCIVAVGVTCVTLPALWKFDARTDPNVAARRREADEMGRTCDPRHINGSDSAEE